ncbi:MAG: CopG family transcriptional regulator [Actinomycetaceae bacterium]|nr:CopG family transcriptional regulator [Actinomycetaceae bacterium]
MNTSAIDWEAMARWAESDDAFARPALGRTLTGTQAQQSARQLLAWANADSDAGGAHTQDDADTLPRRQVFLPADINARLDDYATATGQTASQIVRAALEDYLDNNAA